MPKLTINISRNPAIAIHRDANRVEHLVYIAVANKKLHYPFGDSRICYIGMTKNGAERIAASAAYRSTKLLALHGVTCLEFFVVSCRGVPRIRSWLKLERALILTFRHEFGALPRGNVQGLAMKWKDELDYFTEDRLWTVLQKYS